MLCRCGAVANGSLPCPFPEGSFWLSSIRTCFLQQQQRQHFFEGRVSQGCPPGTCTYSTVPMLLSKPEQLMTGLVCRHLHGTHTLQRHGVPSRTYKMGPAAFLDHSSGMNSTTSNIVNKLMTIISRFLVIDIFYVADGFLGSSWLAWIAATAPACSCPAP